MQNPWTKNSIPAVMAMALMLGAVLSATADDQAAGTVLQEYGATKVIKVEPVDDMFSHKVHVMDLDLDCDSCHPDLFERKRGAAAANGDYNMDALAEGKYCGACHDGSTAFSSTEESDCASCHTGTLDPPQQVIFTKPVKAVTFEHAEHVDMGFSCDDCHNTLFAMQVGQAEKRPDLFVMQALYDGQYCGGCHNGTDAFASDTMCTSCHIGVKGLEKMTGTAEKVEH